jgi:hypothetical protein
MSYIYDLEYKDGICAVVGILASGDTKNIAFKSYFFDQVRFEFIIDQEIIVSDSIQAKLLSNKLENTFIVLSKTIKEVNPIELYSLSYNQNNKKWSQKTITNFKDSLKFDFNNIDNTLSYAVLTRGQQLFVIYHKNELHYLDNSNGTIQARKSLNETGLDYFVKSKNLINGQKKLFYQFENTNDFIGLNNMKQIVYIKYINENNKIELIKSPQDESKFVKIGLFKHILFAFCEQKHELNVYNLKSFIEKDAFNNPIFKHLFPDNSLQFACISDDCEYLATVEIPKMLSLYRLSDCKRIAHVPLYNEINSILMSDHYVVMGMQDKRILSYLIVDPLKSDHEKRIAALDSR